MEDVGLTFVLHAKVVHAEGEFYFAGDVGEEARREGARYVAIVREMLF